MNAQLADNYLRQLRQIVARHVDVSRHQPIIFGSRAVGTAQRYSDIDLGFLGEEPVDPRAMLRIIDELEEPDLPYRVDVVDFAGSDPDFKSSALKNYTRL